MELFSLKLLKRQAFLRGYKYVDNKKNIDDAIEVAGG
jgi:hypothetical protein